MKKFLLIAASAAFVLSATATHTEVRFTNLGNKQLNEKRAATLARINRATDESKLVWKPGKQSNYFWWENEWSLAWETTYTYTDEGRTASAKLSDGTETRFEYDAEGRLISETNYSTEGEATEKHEYAYDSVIKNLIIRVADYVMDGSDWKLNSEDFTEITRNSDNNITQISEGYIYNSEKTEDQRAVYTYGDDKKINTIKVYDNDGDDELTLVGEITDIKWEKTNGQLIDLDMEGLRYYFSDNWIASATLPKATNEPYLGDILMKVEYKAGLGGFKVTQTMNNEIILSDDFTITDTYGSYTVRSFEVDFDNDDDIWFRYDEYLSDFIKTYDKFGNILVQKEIRYADANPEKILGTIELSGNVVYDPETGYPTEYTTTQKYDENPASNNSRTVWSDYKSFEAGIGAIATDNENAPVEYFDLRGRRIDNPAGGFFIRRQGNNVEKIVIR